MDFGLRFGFPRLRLENSVFCPIGLPVELLRLGVLDSDPFEVPSGSEHSGQCG